MLYWATWVALSSITWVVLATRIDSPPLIGVVCGVLGACALRRPFRIHVGRSPPWRTPMTLLAVVSAADRLGADPAYRNLPVAINIGALAWLYFAMARELCGHARADVRMRWPLPLALPVLLGAMVFASRSLRAWARPESVQLAMVTHGALNARIRAGLRRTRAVAARHVDGAGDGSDRDRPAPPLAP